MAGNILGRRSYYNYESDSGDTFSILTDDSLAAAAGLVAGASNQAPPRRFQPRVVFVEGNFGGQVKRKSVIIGDPLNAAYASNTTSDLVIDGLTYQVTGRRGEQVSFPRNSDALDPGDSDVPSSTAPPADP